MTKVNDGLIRVVLVEANPLLRVGMRTVLAAGHAQLVGEVGDSAACREVVAATAPDIVLLDLDLPDRSGLATIRTLLRDHRDLKVVATASSGEGRDELVASALLAGAKGYLLKDMNPALLMDGLDLVHRGGVVLGPGVGGRFSALLGHLVEVRRNVVFRSLTAREHDVLDLVANGFDNRHIARALALSDKTVRNYVSAVITKLGATSRGEAIVVARTAGVERVG
ncbi:response regulator transcription factor [Streptomyces sp. ASQP_92]|uniref:LuxR C-terminal-related transcriptional regulator n=1 Tax=unclassified Streptomyces TaxID=2593676 RepID=UPI0021BEAF1D|nr:response regulator transcription factor [Streptomyces sp. ASQP_92]MCT9091083.1 response regulator transcription factor [Streptomyces sp. ASQP_92]